MVKAADPVADPVVAKAVVDSAADPVVDSAAADPAVDSVVADPVVAMVLVALPLQEWAALVPAARECSFSRPIIIPVGLAAAIVLSISTGGCRRAVPANSVSTGSRQDTGHHRSGNVGKAEIAALIFVGQLLVV